MPSPRSILVSAAFVALAAFAKYCLYDLYGVGSFFVIIDEVTPKSGPMVLPGTTEPARTHFTGVAPIDGFLVLLLQFFWTGVNGQLPALSLFLVYMAGQCLAMHAMVVMEGMRAGNRGRVIS